MDVSYLPLHCHPPKHSVFLSQTITKLHRIVGRIVSSQLCISVCLVTVQCHFSWWWCQEEWKIASVEGFLESAIWHHCRTSPTDLPKSIPLKSHLPPPFVRSLAWNDASAPYVHILIWRETKWILGLIHRHRRCTTKTTTDVWQRQPATSPYHPRGKHRYCIFVAVVALWNQAQIKKNRVVSWTECVAFFCCVSAGSCLPEYFSFHKVSGSGWQFIVHFSFVNFSVELEYWVGSLM